MKLHIPDLTKDPGPLTSNFKSWVATLNRLYETRTRLRRAESMIVFILFSLVWGWILVFSGSLTSGFHLLDDHEIISMSHQMQSSTDDFGTIMSGWVKRDLNKRFRPIYYVHRIIEAKLFGGNLFLWSCYHGVLALLTSYLLYLFCRLNGTSSFFSLVFPFIALIGPQVQIWWCLGPAEVPGIFLFSLSLVLVFLAARSARSVGVWKPIFVLTIVLMSLCKESFILLIPFFAILFVALSGSCVEGQWRALAKRTAFVTFALTLIFLAEISVILFVVGTSGEGYAGVDRLNLIGDVQNLFAWSMGPPFYGIILCALASILVNIVGWGVKSRHASDFWQIVRDVLQRISFALLIIIPQVVLYSKSGLFYSYYLPITLGFSLLLYPMLHSPTSPSIISRVLVFLCIAAMVLPNLKWSYGAARYFAVQGEDINSALMEVRYSTQADTPILIVADPAFQFEQAYSLKTNLNIVQERRNLYIDTVLTVSEYNGFQRSLIQGFGGLFNPPQWIDDFRGPNKIGCIIVFPNAESAFLKQRLSWFGTAGYRRHKYENFILYLKNC